MNESSIKISLIIPVYNVEPYLSRCLDSIIAQTYRNWEILAVDDGSIDDSGRILDEYALKDDRIKVLHIPNNGVSNARNVGMQLASGDYIGFVDSDDWIEPTMYENLIEQSKNDTFDIVQCAYDLCFEDGHNELISKVKPQELNASRSIVSAYFEGNIYQSIFSKIYKRSLLSELKFDIRYPVGEDTKFVYECCKKAASAKIIQDIAYHYFIRSTSTMNGLLKENHFLGLDIVDLQLNDNKENDMLYKLCIRREVVLCMDLIYSILRDGLFEERFNTLRNRVINRKNIIFCNSNYSLKFKIGVFLLWLTPTYFKKIYISSR